MCKEAVKPLVMTVNCFNRMGSTGKIIEDIDSFCKGSYRFIRVYEYEQTPDASPNSYRVTREIQRYFYYVINRLTGYKYCTGLLPTAKTIALIKKTKPDIVHMHCPNMGTIHITRLMNFLKKRNIPTVITNHAEFYYTGNCPHAFDCKKYMTGCGNCDYVFDYHRRYLHDRTAHEWKLMKLAFADWRNVTVVSVSPWQRDRSAASPIMEGIPQRLVLNGVDEKIFYLRDEEAFRDIRKKGYPKVIFHVTANFSEDPNDLKNGRAVIELAKRLPEYAFVVVGPNQINSRLPENLFLYGWVSDQKQLASYYSDADLTVITSKRETFGMSCAESLCCGTPVVGFQAGGPETISLPEYSEFVPFNNIDLMSESVKKWAEQEHDLTEMSRKAISTYKRANMGKGYKDIYDELLKNKLSTYNEASKGKGNKDG